MAGHIASSSSVLWNTRLDHLDLVRKVFCGPIELDPCWNPDAVTDPKYICYLGNQEDGLELPWGCADTAFVNPPFGTCYYHVPTGRVFTPEEFNGNPTKKLLPYSGSDRKEFKKSTISKWIEKCANEAANGLEVIALVPAAVDTAHWQWIIYPTSHAVCYTKGRIRFYQNGKQGGPAPMACAFVYWGPRPVHFEAVFDTIGHVS